MFKSILPDYAPELVGKNFIHQVLQNVGVLRISGADLFEGIKNEKIMYYIEEIGAIAVKATTSTSDDIMYGASGYPVAGSNTIRDLIQYPTNGQLYYSVEDHVAYVFDGSAWIAKAPVEVGFAPQAHIVETNTTLQAGLRYLAIGALSLVLPSVGLRDGHCVELTTTAPTTITGGSIFYLDTIYTSVPLEANQRVLLIYFDGTWYSDVTLMRRIYVTDVEPTNAPEGSIWIDTSEV